MTSHEEKIVNQWRKEHPIADACVQLILCLIFFGLIPMFFGVFYKLFGCADTPMIAWIEGLATTLSLMTIASFFMKGKHGKR